MNNEIFELSEEEILVIAGGGQIDPPAALAVSYTEAPVDYPIIENNPP